MENKETLVKLLGKNSYDFERSIDPVLRRRTGSYYTSFELTIPMVRELIENLPKQKRDNLHKLRFLEPCVGTGNFVFAYILVAAEYVETSKIKELLNNIYVCDINDAALAEYRKNLSDFVKSSFDITLNHQYYKEHVGGALLFDVTQENPTYISIGDVFSKNLVNGFDIVITNPPYKNLKAELGHYETETEKSKDKKKYETIGKLAKNLLPMSSSGTNNLYKLFVEEIIYKYATKDALVSLLVPTSILTDKTCQKIRSSIVKNHRLISIKNIPENNPFIGAQQALTVILIDKVDSNPGYLTSICKSLLISEEDPVLVDIRQLATKDNGYSILLLNKSELQMLESMTRFPKIKDIPFIVNLRGELDLTANKRAISSTETDYTLLRGRNIGYYKLIGADKSEYVDKAFVQFSAKNQFIKSSRLACQQISNIAKDRRLIFAKVDPNFVLANSCNFIAVKDNEYGVSISYLYGILNSKIMNWFFKIHSSNNHINNYELDNLPIPLERHAIKKISELVSKLSGNSTDSVIIDKIDDVVATLFGVPDIEKVNSQGQAKNQMNKLAVQALQDLKHLLPAIQLDDVEALLNGQQTIEATTLKYSPSISSFENKVVSGIVDKYKKLNRGSLLNHTTFKLSDLDMEMIGPIPQGGNWKNIPKQTVNKSRRLKRITETGGRTTLYGRLHYQRPSYTITTYFNRPGNGTYVHPVHNRVLSVREAARFQSFDDDYYFYGNKTQLLKQIGNAVPALLAYQIGRKITDKLGKVKSLDLFCGAGGLTAGFKKAGIDTVLCTDFDEAACTTIKVNNPDAEVICGNITNVDVKSVIAKSAKKSKADIVCGGPPCQGFSMAGYRDKNDPRNQLFKEFVSIVDMTKPKIVLFENVEGILTFNGGETYEAIHELFSGLGYRTEGRLLKIDKYGVPQKRKRVIIICTRNDLNIDPSELYPEEITPEDQHKVTVYDSISDLELVECSEDAAYTSPPQLSNYNRMLKGLISHADFLGSLAFPQNISPSVNQTSLFS